MSENLTDVISAPAEIVWVGPERDAWDFVLRVVIVAMLSIALILTLAAHGSKSLLGLTQAHAWVQTFVRWSFVWASIGIGLMGVRTWLWFRYCPDAPAIVADAPSLTVIIPAYNEGAMVATSIDSVAAAAYPRERLEIFVVDDGSTDDTWSHIEATAARHPGLVATLRLDRNQGKRAALAAGFAKARGEIAVTIDSDSVIDVGTLLAIVGPFRDARVGAVAGKVEVLNRDEGLIPRMLQVRYLLSFDFLRAAQSMYRTVYCCPGALAAYRLAAVRAVLPRWLEQRFLGAQCTYGEDRALTNFILAEGYDTLYQSTAVVRTLVPLSYTQLSKMFLRWTRSYIREDIRLAKIVWKRPAVACAITVADRLITNLRYPIHYLVVALILWAGLLHPELLLEMFAGIGAFSALYTLYYLRSERSWNLVYGIVYGYYSSLTLFWIFPFAAVTLRSRAWLTR